MVFPQPDGPNIDKNSPSYTSNETSSTTTFLSNSLVKLQIDSLTFS